MLDHVRLVIPYDEFLVVHHILVEWELRNNNPQGIPNDMYTYFEMLLQQNLRHLTVSGPGRRWTARGPGGAAAGPPLLGGVAARHGAAAPAQLLASLGRQA